MLDAAENIKKISEAREEWEALQRVLSQPKEERHIEESWTKKNAFQVTEDMFKGDQVKKVINSKQEFNNGDDELFLQTLKVTKKVKIDLSEMIIGAVEPGERNIQRIRDYVSKTLPSVTKKEDIKQSFEIGRASCRERV